MSGEKSEKATHKRKQDERKKGNIFQSKDVVSVFSLILIFLAMKLLAPLIIASLKGVLTGFIGMMETKTTLTAGDMTPLYIESMKGYSISALPLLVIAGLVSIIFTVMQTKFLFTTDALKFKGNRINPIEGFKKLFSIRSLVEVVKAVIKITVLGSIIYNSYKKQFLELPKLMDLPVEGSIAFTADMIFSIVKSTAAVFIFVAILDYAYQWWDYEKNLRMSKQEIKEEFKQTEGDPQVKGKIKEKQHQQAMSRMMQNVPNADVIVRNPTHFAVALKYEPEKNRAPMVLAKGMDHIAFRIIEEAEKYNIPMMENRPLARGLYDAVEINMEIPEQFYKPVAEVLAFVYNLKKKDLK